jgi:hypothetical protein
MTVPLFIMGTMRTVIVTIVFWLVGALLGCSAITDGKYVNSDGKADSFKPQKQSPQEPPPDPTSPLRNWD